MIIDIEEYNKKSDEEFEKFIKEEIERAQILDLRMIAVLTEQMKSTTLAAVSGVIFRTAIPS